MPFTPLTAGVTATPIVVPTAAQLDTLMPCGAMDISLLNGILKTIADRVDAIDATDSQIVGATYNAATNMLTFTVSDGPPVPVDLAALIADAAGTGLILSSIYNPGTNILTLTTANGDNIPVDLSAVITDAVATTLATSSFVQNMGMFWFASIATIPTGWRICDGTGGTPDLRDMFIIGAGGTYTVGATVGVATATINPTALDITQMPAHSHGSGIRDDGGDGIYVYGSQAAAGGGQLDTIPGGGVSQAVTETVGGGQGHTHTMPVGSNIPPSRAYPIIMKV